MLCVCASVSVYSHKTRLSVIDPTHSITFHRDREKNDPSSLHPVLKKKFIWIKYPLISLFLSLSRCTILHSSLPPRRILPLSLISCCKGIVQELHLDTHSISPLTYHFPHHEGEESYPVSPFSHFTCSMIPVNNHRYNTDSFSMSYIMF